MYRGTEDRKNVEHVGSYVLLIKARRRWEPLFMRKQSWKISHWVHLDGFEYASYEVYLGYGIYLHPQKSSYINTNVYMINTGIIFAYHSSFTHASNLISADMPQYLVFYWGFPGSEIRFLIIKVWNPLKKKKTTYQNILHYHCLVGQRRRKWWRNWKT